MIYWLLEHRKISGSSNSTEDARRNLREQCECKRWHDARIHKLCAWQFELIEYLIEIWHFRSFPKGMSRVGLGNCFKFHSTERFPQQVWFNVACAWFETKIRFEGNSMLTVHFQVLQKKNVHFLISFFNIQSYRSILNKVASHYFNNVTTDGDKSKQFVNMISDLNMNTPIDKAVKSQAKYSKRSTYYYQYVCIRLLLFTWLRFVNTKSNLLWLRFSIDGKFNFIKRQLNTTWPGATHCDDLCYIFR